MAEKEQGDKNVEISDAMKMDKLMDMLSDTAAKFDAGFKRMDSRMDALEEGVKRADARMDALTMPSEKEADSEEEEEKKREDETYSEIARKRSKEQEMRENQRKLGGNAPKDAKKDAEEEEEDDPMPTFDKKRKDSAKKDGELPEALKEHEFKKDAKKDEEEMDADEEKEEMKDSVVMTKADLAALNARIADLQRRAPALITDAAREQFASIQEKAEPYFNAIGDKAPGPLDGETPVAYKRRLGSKLQGHSKMWKDIRLTALADEKALDVALDQIYADSAAAARSGAMVPAGHLHAVTQTQGGHTITTYHGEPDSWMNRFAGHSQRGVGDWKRPN